MTGSLFLQLGFPARRTEIPCFESREFASPMLGDKAVAHKRRGGGADRKGRSSNTDRFVRLGHNLLSSNAYRALTPNARSLLVELAMLDNGANNGSLYLSVRDAAARMGVADLTAASRAFDELMALGFIDLAQDAHFRVKAAEASRARCWRLTWLPCPSRKAPTWDACLRTSPTNHGPEAYGSRAARAQELSQSKRPRKNAGMGFQYIGGNPAGISDGGSSEIRYAISSKWRISANGLHSGFRYTYSYTRGYGAPDWLDCMVAS